MLLYIHTHTYLHMYLCAHIFSTATFTLILAGPGDVQLQQPHFYPATRLGNAKHLSNTGKNIQLPVSKRNDLKTFCLKIELRKSIICSQLSNVLHYQC